MATLQVRDMDNRLYDCLKYTAKAENRSISQQVITILEDYFTSVPKETANAADEFLKLAGTWADDREPAEIIEDIRKDGVESSRFGADNVLFD